MTELLAWQFVYMPWRIFEVAKGVFMFINHVFAPDFHARHLLDPWHRQTATKQVLGLDIAEWGRVKVFNVFSRIIGGIFRLAVLLAGGMTILAAGVGLMVMLTVWYLWPIICVGLVLSGLSLIF